MTLGLTRNRATLEALEALATSRIGEDELMVGYAGARRVEACVCGGYIAVQADERSIAYGVGLHNETPRHQAWRRRREGW